MPVAKIFLALGSLNAMLAVILGAFGAHGLKGSLSTDMLAVYQTGVQYHFYHAFGLFAAGLILLQLPSSLLLKWCGWLMCAGIVLFSGSLYLLAITGQTALGMITPIGGIAFIASWLCMFIAILKNQGGQTTY